MDRSRTRSRRHGPDVVLMNFGTLRQPRPRASSSTRPTPRRASWCSPTGPTAAECNQMLRSAPRPACRRRPRRATSSTRSTSPRAACTCCRARPRPAAARRRRPGRGPADPARGRGARAAPGRRHQRRDRARAHDRDRDRAHARAQHLPQARHRLAPRAEPPGAPGSGRGGRRAAQQDFSGLERSKRSCAAARASARCGVGRSHVRRPVSCASTPPAPPLLLALVRRSPCAPSAWPPAAPSPTGPPDVLLVAGLVLSRDRIVAARSGRRQRRLHRSRRRDADLGALLFDAVSPPSHRRTGSTACLLVAALAAVGLVLEAVNWIFDTSDPDALPGAADALLRRPVRGRARGLGPRGRDPRRRRRGHRDRVVERLRTVALLFSPDGPAPGLGLGLVLLAPGARAGRLCGARAGAGAGLPRLLRAARSS